MRFISVLTCGLLLWLAPSARAGLYNTSEPEEGTLGRDNFAQVFRDTLLRLRSIGMPQVQFDNPLRKRYLLAASLGARANPASLTSEQKLNLSAALIRCKKADEAINLLAPLASRERENFLVLGNLATAYQQAGQESRAILTLEQALPLWPKSLGDVPEPMRAYLQPIATHDSSYNLFRTAEGYQLKLLQLRAREALATKGRSLDSVDALFDDGKKPPSPVKFVGESGKFEPGNIAAAEKAKLPPKAIDIVEQLLVWLPEDVRLYWLLGELYNAQGGAKNIQAARMIFDELAGFGGLGVRAAELAEHRKVLLSYHEPDAAEPTPEGINKQIDDDEKKRQDQGSRIDWQTLGVGFATGLVVAIFGMWQFREIRRRLQNRVPR